MLFHFDFEFNEIENSFFVSFNNTTLYLENHIFLSSIFKINYIRLNITKSEIDQQPKIFFNKISN